MKFNKEQKEIWQSLSNIQQIKFLTYWVEAGFQKNINKLKENNKLSLLITTSILFLFALFVAKFFINNNICFIFLLSIYLLYLLNWVVIRIGLQYIINNEIKIKTKIQLALEKDLNEK